MQEAAQDRLRQCPKCQVIEEGSEQYCGDCGVPLGDEVLVSGRFRVRKKLGQGTFGSVWDALDINLGDREVAIKLLRPVSEASQQFAGEIKALTRIKDRAHVVTVFDGGLLKPDNRPFIVMEKLDGQTLQAYRERSPKGRLPPDRALAIILQAARGVAAAHRQEITHRDLSPSNLFVLHDERDGIPQIRVLDFGVALLKTETLGSGPLPVIGTPGFVAPEVLAGAPPSPTADVYSLGAIWFLLLEGDKVPTDGLADRIDLLDRRLRRTGNGLSGEALLLLNDMLSPDLGRRPADASALVQRLRRLPERSGKKTGPGSGRRYVLAAAAGLLAAAALGTLWLWPRPTDPSQQALQLAHTALQSRTNEQRRLAVETLQESSDPRQAAALIPRLQDPDPAVVERTILALEHLRGEAASVALWSLRNAGQNPFLAARASLAIAHLGDADGAAWLRQRLASTFPDDVRVAAALMLLQLEQPGDEALSLVERAAKRQAQTPTPARLQSLLPLQLLARRKNEWALTELQKLSQTAAPTGLDLLALQHLAAIHDEPARARLQALAKSTGENQLLAALGLATLGDPSICPLLFEELKKGLGSEAHRGLLLNGLLHCSGEPIISLATDLLRDSKLAMELRLRAGAIVLREKIGRANYRSQLNLDAQQATSLYAMSVTLSEDILADLDATEHGPGEAAELQAASPGTRERYLRQASWELTELVRVLPTTPSEAKSGVIGAIARAVTRVRRLGGSSQETRGVEEILRLQASSPDRLTALSALIAQYRLGDTRHEARIRSSLRDPSPWIRRKSLEALPLQAAELLPLLADADPGVQLLTVRRLLALGRRAEVKETLRALVQAGGGYGLLSLDLLRQIEPQAEALSDAQLWQLLGSGALPDRLAVVALSSELSSERALPLLQRALDDPSVVIRRRVIEQCQRRYLLASQALRDSLRHLIEALRNDRELIVRTWAEQALQLLADLPPPPVLAAVGAGTPDGAPLIRGGETGILRLRRQPEVQLWLDGKTLAGSPNSLTLPAGVHSLSYLTGEKSFTVPGGGEIVVDVPVQAIQQALHRLQIAIRSGQRKNAETAKTDAERYYQRYHPNNSIAAEYFYTLGRWDLFSGQKPEAMSAFTEYLALANRGFYPERRAEALSATAVLRRELAEVIIWQPSGGICREHERQFVKPVHQTLKITGPEKKAIDHEIFPEAGKTSHIRIFCNKIK